MLASDVWIEMLAILSHEDVYNSVDPLSSEDVAVVVDFRLPPGGDLLHELVTTRLRSPTTVDGKDVRLITGFLPEPVSTRYSSAPSITTV